ncbi:lactoylglutathione lyase [Lachnospiraceae bacterium PM6-15]|uniref:VOC family protein n=1 Tax=Ohessyouella blattaphilus TaxID=2949333 RepID=UPI003E18519B
MESNITGLQHIGIPTEKYENTKAFYTTLGFKPYGETIIESKNQRVVFMRLGNIEFEVYEVKKGSNTSGAIDHVAIDVKSIEEAYSFIKGLGFTIIEEEITSLPLKENGVLFFTILGPNGEKIEFNQAL